MRRHFIAAQPTDSLLQAAQLMQLTRIRHLPVVQDGRVLGIVTHADVMEASASSLDGGLTKRDRFDQLRQAEVARVMRPHDSTHTIAPSASLVEAVERMLRHRLSCLLVVAEREARDGGATAAQDGEAQGPLRSEGPPGGARSSELLGLITQSDLLAAAYLPGLDARTLESLPADSAPAPDLCG
jgi:CBS domain-containing membrane protein